MILRALSFVCMSQAAWLNIQIASHMSFVAFVVVDVFILAAEAWFIHWALRQGSRRQSEYERDPAAYVAEHKASALRSGVRSRWLWWALGAVVWSAVALLVSVGGGEAIGGSAQSLIAGLGILVAIPLGIITGVIVAIRSFRRDRRLTASAPIGEEPEGAWR